MWIPDRGRGDSVQCGFRTVAVVIQYSGDSGPWPWVFSTVGIPGTCPSNNASEDVKYVVCIGAACLEVVGPKSTNHSITGSGA